MHTSTNKQELMSFNLLYNFIVALKAWEYICTFQIDLGVVGWCLRLVPLFINPAFAYLIRWATKKLKLLKTLTGIKVCFPLWMLAVYDCSQDTCMHHIVFGSLFLSQSAHHLLNIHEFIIIIWVGTYLRAFIKIVVNLVKFVRMDINFFDGNHLILAMCISE